MLETVCSYEMLLFHATTEMLITATSRQYFHVEFQSGTEIIYGELVHLVDVVV